MLSSLSFIIVITICAVESQIVLEMIYMNIKSAGDRNVANDFGAKFIQMR